MNKYNLSSTQIVKVHAVGSRLIIRVREVRAGPPFTFYRTNNMKKIVTGEKAHWINSERKK